MTHTADSLQAHPRSELVAIYNGLRPDKQVKDFRSKEQAITRILQAIEENHAVAAIGPANIPGYKPTVAQRTRELLLRGLTDEEVWDVLRAEYVMVTTIGYVAWYRRGMEFGFKKQAA